jgi:hypothetical protein
MPDLCRGSGGSANPVYGTVVAVTSTAIEAFLVTRMPRPVAQFFSPILAGLTYDLETVCNAQPPVPVALTDQDVRDLSNIADPIPYFLAANKLKDWFLAQYWGTICVCGDGLPPAAVTAPALPPVSVDPGLPTGSAAAPCWDLQRPWTFTFSNSVPSDLSPLVLPQTQTVSVAGTNTGGIFTAQMMPAGVTQVSLQVHADHLPATSSGAVAELVLYTSSGSINHNYFIGIDVAGTPVPLQTFAITPGTVSWQLELLGNGGDLADGWAHVTFACTGGTTPTLTTPCCPPDPSLTLKIDAILGMLTLIQRQAVPFAYVPGALHSALTGHGEISLQGLLGVKVTPTTVPPGVGVDVGDPDTLWLESWINWGNPDGWHEREFLRSSPHVSLPALAGQYTKLGYTLRPGLVVDILELKREP